MTKSAEITKLQDTMENMPKEAKQIFSVDHFFSDGVYARVCTIEAGGTIVGKAHKANHLSIVLEGSVLVASKYGACFYTAPYIIHSMVGDKRAFVAKTKVKYMTIHATSETDLAKLEAELVEN